MTAALQADPAHVSAHAIGRSAGEAGLPGSGSHGPELRPQVLGWDVASGRAAAREVLGYHARHLMELPSPPRIAAHAPGVPGIVRFGPREEEAAGDTAAEAASEPGSVVFSAEEWSALVEAAEADRVWPRDFVEICELKHREPGWSLTRARALAGGQPDVAESWTVTEVLERLGLEVLSVGI